jgi:predicted transcriptional regulator
MISNFFQKFPAVSKTKFCAEAGISTRSLYYYETGQRQPKDDTRKRIIETMIKYGHKPE